ncbi:hypothetical protein GYB22_07040 [bacterium]|nr:hypothetical protein [bacterium]
MASQGFDISESNITNYTIKHGLPSNEVYRVVQDHEGFMWFATDRGIARFDFKEFKYYGVADGLRTLICVNMKLDQNGNLYVYCHKDGFYKYNRAEDIFEYVLLPEPYQNQFAFDFYFDEENNMLVSFGTFRYVKIFQDNTFMEFDFPFEIDSVKQSSVILNGPTPLLSDHYKVDGIYPSIRFKGDYVVLQNAGCYHVVKQSNGILVSSTGFELIMADPKRKKGRVVDFKTNHVAHYYYKGKDWVFTSQGIITIDSNFQITHLPFFKQFVITDAIEDYEGQLWLTTHDHGVIRFHEGVFSVPAPSGALTDIALINDKLYFSTGKGAILRYDSVSNTLLNEHSFARPQYEIITNNGLIYNRFGSYYNPENNKEQVAPYKNLGYPRISNPFSDPFQACGIRRLKFYRDTVLVHTNFPQTIQSIKWSKFFNDFFFIGNQKGLTQFSYIYKDDKLTFYDEYTLDDSCSVTALNSYGEYILYSTLEKGFGIYKPQSKEIVYLKDLAYCPTERINTFRIYNDDLYLFTNIGLLIYQISRSSEGLGFRLKHVLDDSYGIQSVDIRNGVQYKDFLVLVGESSVDFIKMKFLNTKKVRPKMVIVQTIILDQDIKKEASKILAYNENNIRFRYNLLTSFTSSKSEPYRVELFHKSKLIIEYYTFDPYAQFIDLDPGDYVFQVEGRNQFGLWSEPVVSEFHINPHFTQTWWFYTIILFILSGIVVMILRERNKRKFRELNYLRKLDVETIKNQEAILSKLKLQMNPHFIYNALNSIQHLFFEQRNKEANSYISTFSRLIRSGLENSDVKVVPVEQEVKFLKDYMRIEKLRFPERFIFNLEVDPQLLSEEYTIPPHLIQPILENSVKHAFKQRINDSEQIDLRIKLSADRTHIIVEVEDNGMGIKSTAQSNLHNSKGLAIVQNQLEILNKSSEFQSTIEIIDKESQGNVNSGTYVVLKIATEID